MSPTRRHGDRAPYHPCARTFMPMARSGPPTGSVRRVLNAVMTRRLRLGLGPPGVWLLTTRGRRTGKPRTTPVLLVETRRDATSSRRTGSRHGSTTHGRRARSPYVAGGDRRRSRSPSWARRRAHRSSSATSSASASCVAGSMRGTTDRSTRLQRRRTATRCSAWADRGAAAWITQRWHPGPRRILSRTHRRVEPLRDLRTNRERDRAVAAAGGLSASLWWRSARRSRSWSSTSRRPSARRVPRQASARSRRGRVAGGRPEDRW
jgi:hypothetical protein